MYKPTVEQLKCAMLKKGYPIKTGIYELNIIGIRNDNALPNSFDDTMCVLFKDEYEDDVLLAFSCTTDPGLYWLQHPMRVEGCAIMKEGYYADVYKIGLHRGYRALQQIGKMWYVRDDNRDATLDFKTANEVHDILYTNIHHAAMPENSTVVDKWSAGCQVINKGWEEFIELCDKSRTITQRNRFSYTLLNINDLK